MIFTGNWADHLGLLRHGTEQRGAGKGKDHDSGTSRRVLGKCAGSGFNEDFNQSLERAGRVADFLEFGELMIRDALDRQESCGGHFNEAYQTEENEAKRDDENFCHVAAWEYTGDDKEPEFHKEPLVFENVELTQRSYK